MSLKPVLVVIPQRTLRFLSGLGSTRSGCPPVLVARRQANSEQQCNSERELCATGREIVPISVGEENTGSPHQIEPSRSVSEEGEWEGTDGGGMGGLGDEAMESEDAGATAPSRAVKHKAVEQRRKKKISGAVQQLLEALQPPSPAGKMTRADILERAVDKIKTLKEENERLKAKIDNLPQPGKETELYGELSKQITEFLALKSQLEHIEKQRNESHDQETESHDLGTEPYDLGVDLGTESHDLVQDQDHDIASREPLPATCANPSPSSSTVITATSSSNSASNTSENSPITTSCSVAHVHTRSATSGQSNTISTSSQSNTIVAARIDSNGQIGEAMCSRSGNVSVVDAPPTVSAHQPWPVTSILSQDSTGTHCQHAVTVNDHVLPTSCHGNRSLTTSGGQNSMIVRTISAHIQNISPVSNVSNISAHRQNISPVSRVSTYSPFHQSVSSVCMVNSSVSLSAQQRNGVTDRHFRTGQNNATSHSRAGGGLASLHGNYQYHHNSSEPQQVIRCSRGREREMGCGGGYSSSNQSRERYHSTSTQVQLHTSAIVQPWVESSHRPRPLHHVTNTTPMPRISHQTQYNPVHYQHHHEEHRRNTHSHTERFMPYPYSRMNHHSSSSTFSPGSWSHDNHVITPVGSSGRDVAPQGRSYASSPYDLHQQQFSMPGRSYNISNYDYSRNNCSTSQGHPSSTQGVGHPSWMPYFTPSQQNSSRSSNMMSHDAQATPPYPIQPHTHGSGSSSTSPAVWRPYSERTRSSGFCLADILSLPSETEATLDVTPPTGHHSFLVNRLLDDI